MGTIAFLALIAAVLFGAYHVARRIDERPSRKPWWVWVLFFGGLVAVTVVLQNVGWIPTSEPQPTAGSP